MEFVVALLPRSAHQFGPEYSIHLVFISEYKSDYFIGQVGMNY